MKIEKKTKQEVVNRWNIGDWINEEVSGLLASLIPHFLMSFTSPHTQRNYGNDLKEFLEFLKKMEIEINNVNEIKERMILTWVQFLQQKHASYEGSKKRIAHTSVARKIASLSSFLNFAHKRKLIELNPGKLILRPKIKRESKTNAFTKTEVDTLLNYLSQNCNLNKFNHRKKNYFLLCKAVISTLFTVGMRVDELCELRIEDLKIYPEGAKLQMTTKGGKSHSPWIHLSTQKILQEYISTFRANSSASEFLFVRSQKTNHLSKLSQSSVYQMVCRCALSAGIDKKVSPHSCRATLATLLHQNSVPIGEIQELLGHSQLTTTAIYLKKSQEQNEAAALKINLLD
jgi:integrase/recombinase XerD